MDSTLVGRCPLPPKRDGGCAVPECLLAPKVRGLCQKHYNRWYSSGDLDLSRSQRSGNCVRCGADLPHSAYGPTARYCSAACRGAAGYDRVKSRYNLAAREETAARRAATVRTCPTCATDFSPAKTLKQEFCSKACSRKAHQQTNTRSCEVQGCARPHAAKGMCAMHWRRAARGDGREANPEWDDRRRANYHKRRALKAGAEAVDFSPVDVFERDGWVCGICCEPVDPDLAWPDPRSASLDHIVPLSKGGSHSPDNAQCAHLVCNVSKGNRA